MKVLIVNWAGLNTGDDIILETCVKYVRAQLGNVEIGLMGHHIRPDLAKKLDCRVFASVFKVEAGLQGWGTLISAVLWADAVIVGGGDILRERVASLAPFAVAAALGRPVCGVGIGVTDRSRSKFWDVCFVFFARSVASLYVRDENSAEQLRYSFKLSPDRLFVAPDVAFASLTPPNMGLASKESVSPVKRVCINLRQLHDPDYQGAINETTAELIGLITHLLSQVKNKDEVEIVLIPMVDDLAVEITRDENDSDLSILEELMTALKNQGLHANMLLRRPTGLRGLEAILAGATLVIGARYHFLIGALSTNATILCVPYAKKVKQLLIDIPGLQLLSTAVNGSAEYPECHIRARRVAILHQESTRAVEKSIALLIFPLHLVQRINGLGLMLMLVFEPVTRLFRQMLGRWIHPTAITAIKK